MPSRPAYADMVEDAQIHQIVVQARPDWTPAQTAEMTRTTRRRTAEGITQLQGILGAMVLEVERVMRPANRE